MRLDKRKRGGSLAMSIKDWCAQRQREKLRQLIVEGCEDMPTEYERIAREWEPAADEVWRNASTPPSASPPA